MNAACTSLQVFGSKGLKAQGHRNLREYDFFGLQEQSGEEEEMWQVLAGDLFGAAENVTFDSAVIFVNLAPRRKLVARLTPGIFFHLRFSDRIDLVFDCHDWSGIILLQDRHGQREIDLFSEEPREHRISLGGASAGDNFVLVTVLTKRNPSSKGNQAWVSMLSVSSLAAVRWRNTTPVPVDTSVCRARFATDSTIVQLHMPHCAGLSLAEAFSQVMQPSESAWLTPDDRSRSEKEAWLRNRIATEGKPRCLYLHEVVTLPNELMGAEFFTLLRKPQDRFLSHYYFVKQVQDTRGYHRSYPDSNVTKSLTSYVEHIEGVGLRREFSAIAWVCDFFGMPATRANAQDLLSERVSFVGISDYFEPCLYVVSMMLGRESVPTWMVRGASSRPALSDLNPQLLKRIDALLEDDKLLYDQAKRVFEEKYEAAIAYVRKSGLSFQRAKPQEA